MNMEGRNGKVEVDVTASGQGDGECCTEGEERGGHRRRRRREGKKTGVRKRGI